MLMNLEEVILASIAEFLDIEVQRDTEALDLSSKIEIVQKRMVDKIKNTIRPKSAKNGSTLCEYEMLFSSNPNDVIKIDGWIPIETNKIDPIERIPEYIEIGLLRKIEVSYS